MIGMEADLIDYLAQHCPPEKEAAIAAQFRATRQFKRAWKIIEPDPQRRAQCEHELVFALIAVGRFREIDKSGPTLAEQRKLLQKLAKTLRVAIDLGVRAGPGNLHRTISGVSA